MEIALKGKSAIVTGASLGIGSACALDLAKNGANVAINYRKHKDEAENLVAEMKKFGVKAMAVQADVSVFADAQKMVDAVKAEFGRIDILINNAGVNWDGVIWKMTEEQWDTVLDINLKGYFNYTRAVSPLMRDQNWGRIINVTSINGLRGKFGQTNYSAAKAGIIGFTKALAKELGKNQITVNAVAPGMILTAMMKDLPENIIEAAKEETVVKRLGVPEDVAYLITFLCSEQAKHITGEVIKVDGGQYI
ncbi:MAG TPA: 3-oxoacyl-ACP reductase family protein [bacterium]